MLNKIISGLENLRSEFESYDNAEKQKEVLGITRKVAAAQFDLHVSLVNQLMANRHKVVNTLNLLLNSVELVKCQGKVIANDLRSYRNTSVMQCFMDFETELNKMKQNETRTVELKILSAEEIEAKNWSIQEVREYTEELIRLLENVTDFSTRTRIKSAITRLSVYLNVLHSRAK